MKDKPTAIVGVCTVDFEHEQKVVFDNALTKENVREELYRLLVGEARYFG